MIFQAPLLPGERREGFREEAPFELVLEGWIGLGQKRKVKRPLERRSSLYKA